MTPSARDQNVKLYLTTGAPVIDVTRSGRTLTISGVVNGANFVVAPNGSRNDVVVTIPAGEAADGKLFGRLEGSE